MPTWPSTLPAPKVGSYKENPPKLTLRTEMEQGPAKVRKRFTAGVRMLSFTLCLTKAEVEILDDFFVDDVASGALSFDYSHPRTAVACKARITKEPQYTGVDPDYYEAQIELEILPS